MDPHAICIAGQKMRPGAPAAIKMTIKKLSVCGTNPANSVNTAVMGMK